MKKVPALPSSLLSRSPHIAVHLWEEIYFGLKRALDVSVSLIVLLLSVPLWLAIVIAVKATSPGPVLFRQERIGARRLRRGHRVRWEPSPFTMYKFRSMYQGAAPDTHRAFTEAFIRGDHEAMTRLNGGSELFKLVRDERVTRVGAFLRRTSLDELPQLINVLRGEMSLVGPRPALPYEIEHYSGWHKRRLSAPPGITGYWQVKGRSLVTFDAMVELDVFYAKRRSLALDLWILFLTPLVVIRRRGAA